ncbi:MAG: MraY family glycosyltransferase [Longimicrobiaceae bacterium]
MLFFALAASVAVLASLLITPAVIRKAGEWNLYDVPGDDRRVHTRPIPRLGGVAVFAATAISLGTAALVWRIWGTGVQPGRYHLFAGILVGGAILLFAGLYDDLRGLRPGAKLVAQVAAAIAVYALGLQVEVLSVGAGTEIHLGWLSLPLTVVWIVGITNAFNLIDGLDGLACGIALVALLTTLGVAVALGNFEVALVCVALSGALLGFLRYNFSPARIFLGDSGSLFIGFMLAVLSVHGSVKSATAVLVLIPLSALALPLLDVSLAVGRRWLRGVPLSGADSRHIHHRLLALGFTHRRAALTLYATAVGLSVLGVYLAFAPPAGVLAASLLGGVICGLLLLYGMRRLDYHEFAEAGAVVVRGALRTRRVIRDQIQAQDIARVIRTALTLEEVDAVLEDAAPDWGFLGMEVCREMSASSRLATFAPEETRRAWKVEHPVEPRVEADDNPFVLRIWCGLGPANRPLGAERVARILAPTIEEWLLTQVSLPTSSATAVSQPHDPPPPRAEIPPRAAAASESSLRGARNLLHSLSSR